MALAIGSTMGTARAPSALRVAMTVPSWLAAAATLGPCDHMRPTLVQGTLWESLPVPLGRLRGRLPLGTGGLHLGKCPGRPPQHSGGAPIAPAADGPRGLSAL